MSKYTALFILLLVFFVVIVFFIFNNKNPQLVNRGIEDKPNGSTIPSSENIIPENYKKYMGNNFSLFYYDEMNLEENGDGPITFAWEDEDGEIVFTIRRGEYTGDYFDVFANDTYQSAVEGEEVEVLGDMTAIVIGDKTGYEFSADEEIGEVRHIYFDAGEGSGTGDYVHVSIYLDDNSADGTLESIVNKMLQSITY